jgi:transposase InsO family protein
MLSSDNGPAFTAQVTQRMAKAIGVGWKLHRAYKPQNFGQVERMNRTLKETLTKLTIKTGGTGWFFSLSPSIGSGTHLTR